jgi:hypothetical protein
MSGGNKNEATTHLAREENQAKSPRLVEETQTVYQAFSYRVSTILIEEAIRTLMICSSRIARSCGVGLDLAIQSEQDCMAFKYFLYKLGRFGREQYRSNAPAAVPASGFPSIAPVAHAPRLPPDLRLG